MLHFEQWLRGHCSELAVHCLELESQLGSDHRDLDKSFLPSDPVSKLETERINEVSTAFPILGDITWIVKWKSFLKVLKEVRMGSPGDLPQPHALYSP